MSEGAPSFLVLQHLEREAPGLIAEAVERAGGDMTVVPVFETDEMPPADSFDALVVMGGPQSANDTDATMAAEVGYVRRWLESSKPYLGVCLGMQVLAKAAEGTIVKSPVKEVGFWDEDGRPFSIELTAAGIADPLFSDVKPSFEVFHLHGETVSFREDQKIALLGVGRHVRNQVIRVGNSAYGIQSHVELTPVILDEWLAEDPDLKPLNANALRSRFEQIQDEYTETGRKIASNFVEIAISQYEESLAAAIKLEQSDI